jgi:hypothetical protein
VQIGTILNRIQFSDLWFYILGNDFAEEFLQTTQSDILPRQPAFSRLCGNCTNTLSWDFRRNVTPSQLRKTADSCSLCGMLWKCLDLEKPGANDQEDIKLFRYCSMLMRKGNKLPVLRICMDPGM